MRLHRRNIVLLFVLVVVVALNVALERPVRTVGSSGALLTDFAPDRVARIAVEAPDGARLEIVRMEDRWTLPGRHGFPALAYAVEELCARLRDLSRADRVSEEADSHERYGVGADGMRLVLEDAHGAVIAKVVQGVTPELGSGSYVRLAGGDEVFRAARLAPLEVDPRRWLDTRLVRFNPAEVKGVVVSHEAGRIFHELVRDADGGWRVMSSESGTAAPRTLVERVLQVASSLYFADVLKTGVLPEDGFGNPPETLIEIDAGEGASLWIGTPTGEGVYPATNPDWPRPWVVALPSESAQVLFAAIEALDELIDG